MTSFEMLITVADKSKAESRLFADKAAKDAGRDVPENNGESRWKSVRRELTRRRPSEFLKKFVNESTVTRLPGKQNGTKTFKVNSNAVSAFVVMQLRDELQGTNGAKGPLEKVAIKDPNTGKWTEMTQANPGGPGYGMNRATTAKGNQASAKDPMPVQAAAGEPANIRRVVMVRPISDGRRPGAGAETSQLG